MLKTMMRKVKKNCKRRIYLLCLLCFFLLCGCASDNKDDPYNFAGVEPKDIDPWTYVKDTSITLNGSIRKLAASSTELAITVGVIGIVFSIVYIILRICFTKNANTKEEIKRQALQKGIIAIMLFSIPFWLGLFKYFAELLV